MRKLWIRRRGVSTMIGGIIVLGLFLTALASMILVSQQYDAYQGTVNKMKQADMDRFLENLRFVSPGLEKYANNPVSCGGQQCNKYTMIITGLVGNGSNIGVQISRIYINSTWLGCTAICIMTPSATAAPFTFPASQRYVNPGEFQHNVTLLFPSTITLPDITSGLNTVTIATTRGRQFSFQWPIPPQGPGAGSPGGQGGTGIYIGPLVITFQRELLFYTTNTNCPNLSPPTNCNPQIPIGGDNSIPSGGGYWVLPPKPPFIIYVKIETDKGTPSDVYLTAQSVLELAKFNNPGSVFAFFVVAPISLDLCGVFASRDPTIICDPSYGYYGTGNNGRTDKLQSYNNTMQYGQPCSPIPYESCPNRIMIPRPTPDQVLANARGNPVVVAFAATTASGTKAQDGGQGFNNKGEFATSFLGLTYVYNDQTGRGDYRYAVTLPFISICFDEAPSTCGI